MTINSVKLITVHTNSIIRTNENAARAFLYPSYIFNKTVKIK